MKFNPLFTGLDTSHEIPAFALYIFGVTGDLTGKKIFPALFSLFLKGFIKDFTIIGFARRTWTKSFFQDNVMEMLDIPEFSHIGTEPKINFIRHLDYISSTFEQAEGYNRIAELGKAFGNKVYYLATPPEWYKTIIRNLGEKGLTKGNGGFRRIIIEKPFGKDLQTATSLNSLLLSYFSENQIFRIDHYLGKETVQNIMALRFGNSIFEPVWNNRYIDHIQITVSEKEGVGTRGNYYEKAGALRDMVQNHLLQLLSLTTMEPPNDMSPETIRGEKVKIVKSIDPITPKNVKELTLRGQYSPGIVDGENVPGYREENNVSVDSATETYVALTISLNTWRWSGVPIFLRSGKRLTRKLTEISIHFKNPPITLFNSSVGPTTQNTLIIRIQPSEGITLNMNAKIPGHQSNLRPVHMDFFYGSTFGETPPEAYERLLMDAFLGDSTLYTRKDEIEASWQFITRILRSWETENVPLWPYVPGSSGPEQGRELILKTGRRWRKI